MIIRIITSGSHAAQIVLTVAIRVRADIVHLAGYASKIQETIAVKVDILDQTYTPVPKIGTVELILGDAVNPIQNKDPHNPMLPYMAGINRYSSGGLVAILVQPFWRLTMLSVRLDVMVETRLPAIAEMKASPSWHKVKFTFEATPIGAEG
ncbi:MAG: hypothetical protein Q9209_001149 [Squamulea sp. 1 TL-2023]